MDFAGHDGKRRQRQKRARQHLGQFSPCRMNTGCTTTVSYTHLDVYKRQLSTLAWPDDWSLRSFVRTRLRADGTLQQARSDGYATGLITFVLEQAGIATEDPRLQRGLSWLARNQNKAEGSWPSLSLSQRRNPSSNVGHFMSDAATAYAVLALGENSSHTVVTSSSLVPMGTRKTAGQAVPSSSYLASSAASH